MLRFFKHKPNSASFFLGLISLLRRTLVLRRQSMDFSGGSGVPSTDHGIRVTYLEVQLWGPS